MADIGMGISFGKTHVEMVKAQIELEQEKLSQMVSTALELEGYPNKIKEDGEQRIMAGLIPVKIRKLKIIPTEDLTVKQFEEFEKAKEEITIRERDIRKEEYKEEQERLKKENKKKKRGKVF